MARPKKEEQAKAPEGVIGKDAAEPIIDKQEAKKDGFTTAEVTEISDNVERNVGFAKQWADMKALFSYVQNRAMFKPDEILFGVTARRLVKYIKSLQSEE